MDFRFVPSDLAVTLWLVNRGWQRVGAVRSNRCVTRRRPHDMRTMHSGLDRGQRIESRAWTRSRSEASWMSLKIRLARGCKRWHPLAPGRRYEARSPLSEYMSLHLFLKLTTNCGPLSRIKWEIYFYKEVCFVRSLYFVNHVWLLCNKKICYDLDFFEKNKNKCWCKNLSKSKIKELIIIWQTDHRFPARKPNLVPINRIERTCLVDFAVSMDD